MAILFVSDIDDPVAWRRELEKRLGPLDFRVWPEIGDPAEIDVALVWRPPRGLLASLPSLRAILALSAGIETLLEDPTLPDVPLCRMVDESLVVTMREFVLAAVLLYHRDLDRYEAQQRRAVWRMRPPRPASATRVGVMGLGALGRPVAETLRDFGFAVRGWSRTPREIEGIACFAGRASLAAFAGGCDVLVNLLPLTPETEGILNAGLFAALPRGAVVINVGRGRHLVDADLIDAVDSGHLRGALLDVFRDEPLPEDHPFWRRPHIRVTPHVAAYTLPESAAEVVAENLRRLSEGRPLLHVVDRMRGY